MIVQVHMMLETKRMILHRLFHTIQDQFQNKLIVDDRKPIVQYQYDDHTTFVVLAPQYEFYHQLILVRHYYYLMVVGSLLV